MAKMSLANKYRPQHWNDLTEQDAIKKILNEELTTGNLKHVLLFTGGAGTGKCLGKDTPVMMYDRTIKLVQDIKEGELLLGPDNSVRHVLSVCNGKELLYKVTLDDGSSFVCNKSHILSLRNGLNGLILDINIVQYLKNKQDMPEYFAYKYNEGNLYDFTIEKLEVGEYFGFEIDGDKRFVLGNGIVTHNTTSGRIFANTVEPVKSNIIEINCADHTGVDDVRQLVIDVSRTKPLTGQYKIFILDECHMLTTQSQNALLKILEEPPSHCLYILCTTDPQKVLPTILSRSFRYDFQLISHKGIVDRLNYVLTKEKEDGENGCGIQSWEPSALDLVATASAGHMRNALVTIEKVIGFSKNITVDDVTKVLGVTNYDTLFNVLNCILQKNKDGLIVAMEQLNNSGMDLKLFIKNFLQFVLEVNKYVILKTQTKSTVGLLTIPSSYESQLASYNQTHSESLKLLLKMLLELNSSIRWETNVKPVLETNLLLQIL